MKLLKLFYCCTLLTCLIACEPTTTEQTSGEDATPSTDTTTTDRGTPSQYKDIAIEKLAHNCSIEGTVLEGNQVWVKDANTLVTMVADSTTFDQSFGESHRVLKVYNTNDCKLVKTETLPINISPDYPYYLAAINYSNTNHLVGIRATDQAYVYDIESQALVNVEPQFLTERLVDDAQSGMILRLEVWENYLVGYAADKGVFVVDLTDVQNPKPIVAHSEFALPDDSFSSLFLLPTGDNTYQALLPQYDFDADDFQLNPLFKKPKDMNIQVSKGARNNRYIILREKDAQKTGIVIDMQDGERVKLPNTVATQKAKSILEWVRKNDK